MKQQVKLPEQSKETGSHSKTHEDKSTQIKQETAKTKNKPGHLQSVTAQALQLSLIFFRIWSYISGAETEINT